MQYNARKFLEDSIVEGAIIEAAETVTSGYDEDLPDEFKQALTIERVEGQLVGFYRFWCSVNDEEVADDHRQEITDLVGRYREAIQETRAKIEQDRTSSNRNNDISIFDT